MALKVGKLIPSKSVLLVCDLQDKFSKVIQHFDQVVETSGRLADFSKLLHINTFVSEHYPKGYLFSSLFSLNALKPKLNIERSWTNDPSSQGKT